MCGIVGVLNLADKPPVESSVLLSMLSMIRHRGPDGFGVYRDAHVGLGNARLSIIDLAGGDQPIGNEDGRLWIVFNGEVFNYVELRPELERRGHRFTTHSDTEVILHLYEDYGPNCLNYLNGQFAIAIWDAGKQQLFLARDRLGVRPLHYTFAGGRLIFGSEVKALLAHPGVKAEIDPVALEQIFTYWSTLTPRSIFRGVLEVPPGHYLLAQPGQEVDAPLPYWQLHFHEPGMEMDGRENGDDSAKTTQESLEELEALLVDATRVRLRADVPVGAYLSGGLDSSTIAAIIRRDTNSRLDTFSIAFADNPEFDESQFQRQMAGYLGTDHRVVECTHADIGRVFPEVIWHTETPILRTAPAPMFLLSKLVNDHHLKVVLTGEGADEFLAGYDIFKEMKVRRFWARNTESRLRPLLLRRLYPDIADLSGISSTYLMAFFKKGLSDTDSPFYSHAIRWGNTMRIRKFLNQTADDDRNADSGNAGPLLPLSFHSWSDLAQAQYLEISIFLSQYLLSSQGDRVAMAHSVEGRYPFLDYRVVELCNRLPSNVKLSGLTEKWLLKQLGKKLLPKAIWQRTKRPYRAPIQHSFFGHSGAAHAYAQELWTEQALQESGLFKPAPVMQLAAKARSGANLSETEEMAVVGILSTQLVYDQFVKTFRAPAPGSTQPIHIKLVDRLSEVNTP